MKIRGLRVEPSRFGILYSSVENAVDGVLGDAVAAGVDHLFVQAYHPSLGAYYPSKAMNARIEPTFGANGFLPKLARKAADAGVKVVASLNLNRFEDIGAQHPDMRVKSFRMQPYEPSMISAYASGFRTWLKTFVDDLAGQHPSLAGLEAHMTAVALHLDTARDEMPDYHREATRLFQLKWPKEPIGGLKWRDYRSQGVSNLHKTLFDAVRTLPAGRAFVCQELPTIAACDPTLMSFVDYDRLSGFGWARVETAGMDVAVLDATWQRREAACGKGAFGPSWVSQAWRQFASMLDPIGGIDLVVQVDTTPYRSVSGTVIAPTITQFAESLVRAFEAPGGAIAGEFCALKTSDMLTGLASVFRP